jgi:hypothetical protein
MPRFYHWSTSLPLTGRCVPGALVFPSAFDAIDLYNFYTAAFSKFTLISRGKYDRIHQRLAVTAGEV